MYDQMILINVTLAFQHFYASPHSSPYLHCPGCNRGILKPSTSYRGIVLSSRASGFVRTPKPSNITPRDTQKLFQLNLIPVTLYTKYHIINPQTLHILQGIVLTLPMLRLPLSKTQGPKTFQNILYLVMLVLKDSPQMSTHMPGFQSFFSIFASEIELH